MGNVITKALSDELKTPLDRPKGAGIADGLQKLKCTRRRKPVFVVQMERRKVGSDKVCNARINIDRTRAA